MPTSPNITANRNVVQDNLFEKAQSFVLQLFGQRQDGRLIVHNYAWGAEVADMACLLAEQERCQPNQLFAVKMAALFLPVGYLYDYLRPEQYSIELAEQFLEQEGIDEEIKNSILESMSSVLKPGSPVTIEAKILSDASQICLYLLQQEERHPQIQLERNFMLSQQYTKAEWSKLMLDELLRIQLHTHSAQAQYQPFLAQSIHKYRQEVEKRIGRLNEESIRFADLEKKAPVRGVQTFFRSNYRNHINLSAIADNKANIMIGINAILISVLITFLSYRNIGENNPQILLPIVMFLATGLSSLIFAVLSVRPKITMLNHSEMPIEQIKKNITFFGNFVTLDLEQYEAAMDEVFTDSALLYGNMVRDLYFLGKVLEKKYRYLSISYTIFMIGFVVTVVSFVLALFM
jgi:hypothetical protein